MNLHKTIIQSLCALVCIAVNNAGYAQQPPVAAFSADITTGCAPLIVQFRDASSNTTFWKWDFGNGTVSSQQNPGVIYTEPGTYTITLVAGNAGGTDSLIRTSYIEVYGKPEVQFTANPLSGCLPMQVQFTNQSNPGSGTITGYTWDFGDGQISPAANPQHTYTTQNNFNISLTVQNSFGCKQVLQKNAFIQTTSKVTANFGYTYANACQSPSLVRFTNQSTGASGFTYKWSFGDGDTSSLTAPEHTYNTPGTYPARLIIFSGNGCSDTITKNITIGNIRPDFTLDNSACSGKTLNFSNASSPTPLSVTWDFGDGGTAATINAGHTYTTAGTYIVKMRANFGACIDSVSKSITITSKPVTAFTTQGPADACAVPVAVQFNNTTTGATGYKWLFGDGTSSTEPQPSHTYQQRGYYNVTLISYNANGCSDTITQNKLIHVGPARITGIGGLPFSGCAPQTLAMNVLTDGSQTITSYAWNFGDGTTSTDAAPSHSYTIAGVYDVAVIIKTSSGCTDTFSLQQAVTLASKPLAGFTVLPPTVCGSRSFSFTDTSSGSVTSWLWNFGDNSTSTLQNPKHGYKDTGYYTITLIVSNNFCSDTLRKEKYVHVDAPIARFTPVLECNQPYVRTFTDRSVAATSWEWDFGDGQTATTRNATHTYTTPGSYIVRLVVTNNTCTDTARTTIVVADEHPSFTYTPVAPYCRKQNIQFTATQFTAANINSFNWDYGDGTSSGYSAQNSRVTHAYAKAGNYTVTLSIKDVNGCTVSAQQTASFDVFGPTAGFSNPLGTCLKNDGTISFTDQTTPDGTNALTLWRWDFGDGKVENFSGGPFTHTYTTAGNYNIKLVVTDASGCKDSLIKSQAVTIADPKAAFALSDSVRCAANNVSFRNNSQGLSLTYRWYFGDGQQSTQAAPTHAYAAQGLYSVALAVKDRLGCTDSIYKQDILNVSNPLASFNLLDTFINCPPLIARPQNTSQFYSSVAWDFDDGVTSVLPNAEHAYTQGGIFNLTLVVKGYGNCTDTARKRVTILGPSGTIQFTPPFSCNPAPIAFKATTKNTQTIVWDFSDGTLLSTKDSLVTHTYTNFGQFTPRLILTDSFNCRVSVTSRDTLTVADVVPGLKSTLQSGCDSSVINFTDSSQVYFDKITGYNWNFGDNGTATTANPMHTYKANGTYQVRLTVTTQQGCSKTITRSVPVRVYSSPRLTLNVTDSACLNSPMRFEVTDTHSDTEITFWQWQYGNGQTSGSQNNTYTYPDAGIYPVQLIARNAFGCADTASDKTTVLAPPRVDAGLDTSICLGVPLTLQPSGADRYTWTQNASLSCTSCRNPVASPVSGTRYYVRGSSNFGCFSDDSLFVDVKQPPRLAGYRNDSLCLGESTQLQVSGAETYEWLPGTGLSNPTIPNPVAAPRTTTTYQLVGADSKKCFSQKVDVKITVFPIPIFHILGDSVRILNVGFNDTLRTSSSEDITTWIWAPANWLSCNRCAEPVTSAKRDIVYTARVFNGGGCTSSDQVTVHVLCNGINIYMPNTFSPNNDGMNDQFYPRGRGLTSIKSLRVFNRWGQPVFERLNFTANSATDGWDGNFGGKPASADVYVYIMEVVCENNSIVSYKGNIALLR